MTDFSSTLTEETKFSDYVQTVLHVLNSAISQNLITPVQFTAVLLQLAELQNTQDLNAKVEELSEKYPALKEILYMELAKTKADLDNQTQLLVSSLIK
jgi:hypothetical protein